MTILPARSDLKTVSKCLPKALHADPKLVVDGGYPAVLLFGCISDAMNRLHPFLGMNYLEIFSAIPGVYPDTLDATSGGFAGPFIYPYRGYFSNLIPYWAGWPVIPRHGSARHTNGRTWPPTTIASGCDPCLAETRCSLPSSSPTRCISL